MSGLRIVFMGTPEFAVESLKILVENNYNIVGVVTVPDKPAGRGQQLQQSAVKKFALEKGLTILQPEKLKDESFISQLKNLNADIQVIVAFRMLPEMVWNMPRLGSFNLHASLLPQYRGAAPINWAVINGEQETGATTFFLQHEIDTGKIIFQEKITIDKSDNAGTVHDKLMQVGAKLVLKTIQAVEKGDYPQIDQSQLVSLNKELKQAPKIFKEDCKIKWEKSLAEIHNLIGGLSPYPAAYTEIKAEDGNVLSLKIFRSEIEYVKHTDTLYTIYTDSKTFLKIPLKEGYIYIYELQLAGKKRMVTSEFLNGFKFTQLWKVL